MKKLTIKTQSIERKSTSGQCLVTFLITDDEGPLEWPMSVADHAELRDVETAARGRLHRIATRIASRGPDLQSTPEENEAIRQAAANAKLAAASRRQSRL